MVVMGENQNDAVLYDYSGGEEDENSDNTAKPRVESIDAKGFRRNGVIDLKRLKIVKIHYFTLVAFLICGYMVAKSITMYADVYYSRLVEYSISGVPAFILALSSVIFTVLSIMAANLHSKSYDTNITSVFEYMMRRGKTKFNYSLEEDRGKEFKGLVDLKEIKDNEDTGRPEIIAFKVPHPMNKNPVNIPPKKHVFEVSELKEVTIPNQNPYFSKDEAEFLEKNEKINQMLRSDRNQLICFVAAYIAAALVGFFLALSL